uniref:F-box domain-containing protein n=1 Tax=Aegilops tauschii TaxID=37682 RepID=M8CGH3_AEGTA
MAPPVVRELWEMEELVEEILVRIPPEEPAVLVRASLACKPWCRLLSGNAFRNRYLTLHKTPPILGFLQSWEDPEEEEEDEDEEDEDEGEEGDMEEGDSDVGEEEGNLKMVVWDPVSGSRTKLRGPDMFDPDINGTSYWGTVLCALDGCNHAACNLGPFFVALITLDMQDEEDEIQDGNYTSHVWASIYSSETREWTSPTSIHIGGVGRFGASVVGRPSVLVGQALHLLLRRDPTASDICILKYDLGTDRLAVIDLPGMCVSSSNPLLISADDSGLGLVHLDQDMMCFICSVEVSVDGVASWTQLREIDLKTLVPIRKPMKLSSRKLVGCLEGTSIIIVVTDLGAFTIDLKSLRLRKLSSKPYKFTYLRDLFDNLFLYTSFNNPPATGNK